MPKPSIYTVGGAVQAGGGLYIQRQADNDLLKLCREGAFAYVLTSRQVGKSSLMVRAAEQLREEDIRSVIVDLTVFGVQVTAEAWYLGLLTAISDRLNLQTDVIEWWRSRAQFGGTQRLTEFFKDVLLAEIKERVVIFIDEIDSTLSLPAANGQPFTDDFYAAIRYLYNARATEPAFRRLSFVLIGVATPSDLIRDPKRTPFNIGSRVDITDFTFDEALPLADGLEMPDDQARNVLRWVIKWTGGHPYLTQRLCRVVAEQYRSNWTEEEIDRTVANTFLGKMSEHDNNLQFVRDMLTRRAPDKLAVLSTYKDIRLGRLPVRDEEQSPIKSHLKLSGVVKREDGKLHVRNPIYREVFEREWIQEHWPVSWWQTVPLYAKIGSGAIVFLAMVLLVLAIVYSNVATEKSRIANEKEIIAQNLRITNNSLAAMNDSLTAALFREKALKTKTDTLNVKLKSEATKNLALAEQERLARNNEVIQRQKTEEEKQRANQREAEANKAKQEEERLGRIAIARTLALQATQEQQLGKNELAALLARQAFLFNKKYGGSWDGQIYEALFKTLNAINNSGGPVVLNERATTAVRFVAFNANSAFLASAGDDKTVRLWNREKNFAQVFVLKDHTQSVRALAFSPNGQTLASASDDQTVRLWDLRTAPPQAKVLNGHQERVWAVAFSPNGKALASAGADGAVILWDLSKAEASVAATLQHQSRVIAVAFSNNGQWLAAGGDDGTIQLWQMSNNKPANMVEFKHESGVKALAFKPNDNQLASGGKDGRVLLWTLSASGKPLPKPLLAHESYVNALAFSADGKKLATGSNDKRAKIWELDKNSSESLLVFNHEPAMVLSVAFSPDGSLLASGGADNLVRVWFTQTEVLANRVCQSVKRNLTTEEWSKYVGAGIEYEKTCDNLPAATSSNSGASKSTPK